MAHQDDPVRQHPRVCRDRTPEHNRGGTAEAQKGYSWLPPFGDPVVGPCMCTGTAVQPTRKGAHLLFKWK
jgi:hypothetical protein